MSLDLPNAALPPPINLSYASRALRLVIKAGMESSSPIAQNSSAARVFTCSTTPINAGSNNALIGLWEGILVVAVPYLGYSVDADGICVVIFHHILNLALVFPYLHVRPLSW